MSRTADRFATLIAVALLAAIPCAAQGALSFERTLHDFGSVEGEEIVEATFAFTNTGDRPLRLTMVRPSCGCTTPYYTEGEVMPGETGEVQVGFDPRGRSGPFRQAVYLAAEVGAEDVAVETLVVSGEVVPEAVAGGVRQGSARFDAEYFNAGEVSASTPLTHRFTMQHTGTRPLQISKAHSFPTGAEVVYPQLPILRDDVVRIEVTLPPELLAGPFDVTIALETDDPEEPIKALRIIGVGRAGG